ncbi:MAG TPA: hypothetical protein VFZ53_28415 [Polyangiaceae bacterium]
MALVNVRLDPEDHRKARALRSDGVKLSALVRDAIRREFERRVVRRSAAMPSALVREVLRSLPDTEQRDARRFALTDRHALRAHIEKKLRRRR